MDARLSNRWIDDSVRDLKYDYNHKMALARGFLQGFFGSKNSKPIGMLTIFTVIPTEIMLEQDDAG